jgi:nitrite reductase/ring-hydroxylating ferredoxin subunit
MRPAVEQPAQHWGASPWHCVGVSDWLTPSRVKAVWAGAEDVVLWRQAEGQLHAWRNQCPHRGVRLSLGCVRNNRLTCRYHGWQFDAAGQCAYVPADPNFAPSAALHADAHACIERDGLVWVGLTNADPPGALLGSSPTGLRSLHMAAPAVAVHEWLVTRSLPTLFERAPVAIDTRASPATVLLDCRHPSGASFNVALAVQALPDGEAVLHAACALPEGDNESRLALLQWLRSLRSAVEATAKAPVENAALKQRDAP